MCLDVHVTSAVRSVIIVSCGKGGLPQISQAQTVPERLKDGDRDGIDRGPLLLHLAHPVDIVSAKDNARELASAADVPHHILVKIVLACHHPVDKISCGRNGAVGYTKNCGGNDAEAHDHAPRRR